MGAANIGAKPNLYCKAIELVCGVPIYESPLSQPRGILVQNYYAKI